MLGKRMLTAASIKYKVMTAKAKVAMDEASDVESEAKDDPNLVAVHHERKSIFRKPNKRPCLREDVLKGLFFLNFVALIGGVVVVNQKQNNGNYRCKSVTVGFGESVWKRALVRNRDSPGELFERTLVYSYFNGIYTQNGTHNGYPRYTEQNKIDGSQFLKTLPAEIVYCKEEERWVFTHPDIVKSDEAVAESECGWLFRSARTREYNLVDVPPDWMAWTGIVSRASDFSMICNEVERETDCNYHGKPSVEALCECQDGFYGTHCEFESPCVYMGDEYKDTVS
ncbi:hypothetical protein ACHAWF_008058 [Thalassiosira exigua]